MQAAHGWRLLVINKMRCWLRQIKKDSMRCWLRLLVDVRQLKGGTDCWRCLGKVAVAAMP